MSIPYARVEEVLKITEQIQQLAGDPATSGEQLLRATTLGVTTLLGTVALLMLEEVPYEQKPGQFRGAFR